MSVTPGLTTTGFWNREAQLAAPPHLTVVEYGMVPRLSATAGSSGGEQRYGMVKTGACVLCNGSLCGGVDPSSGRPLPEKPCAGQSIPFNCYYPSMDACYAGNDTRSAMVAGLTATPFTKVMEVSYAQPSYAEAFQTMLAGKL
jgi:hypothetical protein